MIRETDGTDLEVSATIDGGDHLIRRDTPASGSEGCSLSVPQHIFIYFWVVLVSN